VTHAPTVDLETAKACGIRTRPFNQILLLTIASTIAVSIMSIGALPVFAFMMIPASAALTLTERLGRALPDPGRGAGAVAAVAHRLGVIR
jgi:ABC-type Mn2+/Zn2+ transport system permease subunit